MTKVAIAEFGPAGLGLAVIELPNLAVAQQLIKRIVECERF